MSAGLNFRIVEPPPPPPLRPVWPDSAKHLHFGKILKVFGHFLALIWPKNWLFWFPAIYKKVTTKKGFRALIPRSVCISMPGRLYVCWRAGGACCWCSQTKWLPFQWIILLLLYIEVLSKSKPKTERNYYYYISKFVRFLALN